MPAALPQDIPGWWVWVYYSNPISYVLWGLAGSQLGDVTEEFISVGAPGEPANLVSVSQYLDDTYGYKWVPDGKGGAGGGEAGSGMSKNKWAAGGAAQGLLGKFTIWAAGCP